MLKRLFDFFVALIGLNLLGFPLTLFLILIWLQDFKDPFYRAPRVGRNGKIFTMYKLRSMVVNADKTGVDSTSNNDTRITPLGKLIRQFKLDEIPQLINVLKGEIPKAP